MENTIFDEIAMSTMSFFFFFFFFGGGGDSVLRHVQQTFSAL